MSYRAFKRLLGETSLERKCRFLFGAFNLLLISASFWLFAQSTENLAYQQINKTCRLLVVPLLAQKNLPEDRRHALERFGGQWQDDGQNGASKFLFKVLLPGASSSNASTENEYEQALLNRFQADPALKEDERRVPAQKTYYYYAAIRGEHAHLVDQAVPDNRDDLVAVLRISIPTETIERGMHFNLAILISTALITALLVMSGSYLIVRYVVVKPVKHLKEVSDAISAGELNVRSEIQTGDEFEDLSHAFNRMLRNLVSMQDRLRKVNTDLDRKVDELAQANMALYESNRLKGDFLATMSHELRTPLNSILGFSEVLLSGNQLTDKQKRWVSNIQSSGERLLNLINDVLDLAKIEAGKMQLRLSEFSVYDVCEGLLNMFRPLAEKKNIDLRGQLGSGIPVLRQDVGKLQQIISNLLSNAIKFTPEGGRVAIKAEPTPSFLVLIVQDTGVGIAPEDQELIFEKFRQAGNPLTRQHEGTGLGLSIVKELCKLLGGEVSMQSELGRGSTFTVRLPLQLSEEPRLEFDLAAEGIDLSKAQRIDARLYANLSTPSGGDDGATVLGRDSTTP
jgi:signal transduction histidine kinase